MNTEALLTLTQWLSPGFPVGSFAYSHGLEQAIDRGDIATAGQLFIWLQDILRHGGARADAVLLAAAYRALPEDMPRLDAVARAFAASSERLTETLDQGAAFGRTVDAVWGTEIGSLCYPLAVGRAARARGLPVLATAEVYLHAALANLVSASVRLVPLGQTEGQQVLAKLGPDIAEVAAEAIKQGEDDLASCCFASDIAAMRHETQYSKVFRT